MVHVGRAIILWGIVGLAATAANATPITVPNFSFESADVPDNGGGTASDWNISANGGVFDPMDDAYPGSTGDNSALPAPAHGGQTGWINASFFATDTATSAASLASITGGTTYQLTVAIGDRNGSVSEPGIVTIELLADGISAAATTTNGVLLVDGFTDLVASFTTTAIDPRIGQALTVRITHTADGLLLRQVNFDNVRVEATLVPEPVGLTALAMLAALLRRRGRS